MPKTTAAVSDQAAATRVAQIARLVDRDLGKAITLARRARGDGIRTALVHHLVGLAIKDEGRYEDAIVELGLGLELEPNSPTLMTTVGFCLLELDRRQEAARVFEAAMKLSPNSAPAAYGYGWAAERLGALDAARSAFERALLLDPGHADALAGLSGLATRRRDWRTAQALATRAALLDPRQTDALMNLARVDLGLGDFDAARERLASIVELPFIRPEARANSRIMLGDAFDGEGRYEEAYRAYADGKAELRGLFAHRFERPGAPTATEVVRAIADEFLETPAEAWTTPAPPRSPDQARGHAFLVGFPRSGTTLLEQVIATHPDMLALGERPVMIEAETAFLSRAGGLRRLADTLPDMLEPLRADYWRRVSQFGIDPKGKVFVDKHPLGAIRLPLIHKMFPAARILFALRDPRDVVLSCFRRSFNMNANMFEFTTLLGAARMYDAVMSAAQTYFDRLPLQVLQIRYESVVADFDASSAAMCDFLGVEWVAGLRDFADTERAIATPSSAQVGRGLYDEGVGQWRHYAFALEPAQAILAPWIERFGYPPGG